MPTFRENLEKHPSVLILFIVSALFGIIYPIWLSCNPTPPPLKPNEKYYVSGFILYSNGQAATNTYYSYKISNKNYFGNADDNGRYLIEVDTNKGFGFKLLCRNGSYLGSKLVKLTTENFINQNIVLHDSVFTKIPSLPYRQDNPVVLTDSSQKVDTLFTKHSYNTLRMKPSEDGTDIKAYESPNPNNKIVRYYLNYEIVIHLIPTPYDEKMERLQFYWYNSDREKVIGWIEKKNLNN